MKWLCEYFYFKKFTCVCGVHLHKHVVGVCAGAGLDADIKYLSRCLSLMLDPELTDLARPAGHLTSGIASLPLSL